MNKSIYLANKTLDNNTGGATYAVPATVYIELNTVAPNDDGSGGVAASIARKSVSLASAFATPASGKSKSNSVAITWPAASGSLGTIAAISIWDASSGGNLLYSGALATPRAIPDGGVFTLPAGALVLNES
jgi:hypothetical protein